MKRLEYLCAGEPNGPNCACCFANRRASAALGGVNSVVVVLSNFDFSPVAVESEIVGRAKEPPSARFCDAVYACCAAFAAANACASVPLDLTDGEKSCESR